MKHTFTNILIALLALTAFLLCGCDQSAAVISDNEAMSDNSSDTAFIQHLKDIGIEFNTLSGYVNEADKACRNLEDFRWQDLDNLGCYQIQEAGFCCQEPLLCDKSEQPEMFSQKMK
jgi:hypothetical protein